MGQRRGSVQFSPEVSLRFRAQLTIRRSGKQVFGIVYHICPCCTPQTLTFVKSASCSPYHLPSTPLHLQSSMAFWKKKPDLEPSIRDVQPGDNIESARSYENDSDLAGLDLLEQKSVLVNRALNSTGMGRYQWTIFFLCGFGYLLDLMWAQAFGLILAPLAAELNIPSETRTSWWSF